MVKLKHIEDRGVTVAWSPKDISSTLLAAGTKEGAGGSIGDYGGKLEFFSVDLSNDTSIMVPAGTVSTSVKFGSLAWSSYAPTGESKFSKGMVAGGMTNGTISIWDPQAVLSGASDRCCLVELKAHTGIVFATAFNPHKQGSQLLGSGGEDCSVFITDLSKPEVSNVYTPGEDIHTKHSSPVTSLAWNHQVIHILASACSRGKCIIWDLRQKRPWCQLQEPKGEPFSKIQWNPPGSSEVLLMTASSQGVKIWDLRKSTLTPMVELGQPGVPFNGVVDAAWCYQDDGLVISCSDDNRTLVWDLYSCSVVDEMKHCGGVQTSVDSLDWETWETQPSKRVESFTRNLASKETSQSNYIGGMNSSGVRELCWSPSLPGVFAGCTFDRQLQINCISAPRGSSRAPKWMSRPCGISFGFGGKRVAFTSSSSCVSVHAIVSTEALPMDLELMVKMVDGNSFQTYCESKVSTSSSSYQRDVWDFLRCSLLVNPRQELLNTLGKHGMRSVGSNSRSTRGSPEDLRKMEKSHVTNSDDDIRHALCVGDFDGAVQLCISEKRFPDALVIASFGDSERKLGLFHRAQQAYLECQNRPFFSFLASLANRQFDQLLEQTDAENWKETLSIFCYTASDHEFGVLCDRLGSRLEEINEHSATLCYMCSSKTEKLLSSWLKNLGSCMDGLSEFVSRVIVVRFVKNVNCVHGAIAKKFYEFAQFLASFSCLEAARAILSCIDTHTTDSLTLHFRLYWSHGKHISSPPLDPFASLNDLHNSRQQNAVYRSMVESERSNVGNEVNGKPVAHVGHVSSNTTISKLPSRASLTGALADLSTSDANTVSYHARKLDKYERDGFITTAGNSHLAAKYGNLNTNSRPTLTHTPAKAACLAEDDTQMIFETLETLHHMLSHLRSSGIMSKGKNGSMVAKSILAQKIETQTLSEKLCLQVKSICSCIRGGNYKEALQLLQPIVLLSWSEEKDWLKPLKSALVLAERS